MNKNKSSTHETDSKYYELMLNALNSVYQEGDLHTRIVGLLGTIGEFVNASRAYVFEDDFVKGFTKNTYEWCAEGVTPQIADLQYVPHSYMGSWHEMLRKDGIILANNLSELPAEVYEQLVVQDILSIMVIPLYINNTMFGYVGFDECLTCRNWTHEEAEVIKALSRLIENLIGRHQAEHKVKVSNTILRTVLDNIETPIYVTDLETYKILFANRKFTQDIGRDLEGEICWEVLNRKGDGKCSNCPCTKLAAMEEGSVLKQEVYNEVTKKLYYCTDNIIEWVDGRLAHMQTSIEITPHKE